MSIVGLSSWSTGAYRFTETTKKYKLDVTYLKHCIVLCYHNHILRCVNKSF